MTPYRSTSPLICGAIIESNQIDTQENTLCGASFFPLYASKTILILLLSKTSGIQPTRHTGPVCQ